MNARNHRIANQQASLIIQVVIGAAILFALYLISLRNYLLFHSIVEFAGIAVAFSIFILVWNTRRAVTNTFFLILGISFLFIGGLDLIHTLAYKGMGVFPGNSPDLPTQLWIAARYFQSVTFFVATLFIGRTLTRDRRYDTAIIVTACATACGLLLASIFLWHTFPSSFIEGSGLTPFKIVSEYVISLILFASVVVLVLKRQSFEGRVWKLVIAALIFLILGELSFTSYVSVYGFMNMLGHLFRLVSVYLFYRAFVVVGLRRPFDLLFRELKQKQEELHTLSEDLSEIIDHAPAMIWYKDLNNTFIRVNPAAAHAFGLSIGEIEGKSADDLFPETAEKYYRDDLEVIRSGEPKIGIIEQMQTAGGETLWVRTDKVPLKNKNGKVTGVLLFVTDITDLKRTEDTLALANRKFGLLSNITRHDILNQLMVLLGSLEIALDDETDPGRRVFIERELQAARTIQRQIEFTREYQELGNHAPKWQNVSESLLQAAAGLPLQGVCVTIDRTDCEVYADPLFQKVFYNLLDNALRYGGDGMTAISVGSREEDDALTITFEDNGVGISAEDKKRLFTKGFGKNTGLGLFLSREILSITGIEITETGIPRKGATFEIRVPKGMYRVRKG